MARNKILLALLCSLWGMQTAHAEEFTPMEGMTVGQIMRAADEISVLRAQSTVEEMRAQMLEKREQANKKSKPEVDSTSAPPPPPPTVPLFTASSDLPIANGITLNAVQGVGDRLVATINYSGAEMSVKGGDILPSGEVIESVAPSSIKVTRITKAKKGAMKRQSKTVFIGNNAADFSANAMPQLPPLPTTDQPGMGAPVSIRPGR